MTTATSPVKIKSSQWQSLLSNELVEIRYRYQECNLPTEGSFNENVYLQMINKTDKKLHIEWIQEYWYNGKCIGCESSGLENLKKIDLQPKEKKEGFCSEKSDRALAIFSKMLNIKIKSELTDFNIKSLKIIDLK